MKAAVQRAVGKVVDVVREMNEAQRLMLVLSTSMDRYVESPGAPPETYEDFLARTSGVLLHEPTARKRARKGRRRAPRA